MRVYKLVWNGEEIDEFETLKEAEAMRTEYEMAYKGSVSIVRGLVDES